MADTKISALTALTGANTASDDLLVIVDTSATETKKIPLTELQSAPVFAGTANGILYLNGSKVASSGSALTFDGSFLVTPSIVARSSASAGYTSAVFGNNAANGYTQLLFDVGINGANGQASISYAPGVFFAIGPVSNDTTTPIIFRLNNAVEQMRLTSTGLGIGTSAPVCKVNAEKTDATAWSAAGTSGILFSASNASATNNSAALYQSSVYYGDGTFSAVKFGAVASGSYSADFVLANRNAGTYQENLRVTANGNLIAKVNGTAPTLGTNGTMSFELTSDTSLKIVVRGSDGTTRSASLTLA